MKKYYTYSVKDELRKCFGSDAIVKMRVSKEKYNKKDIEHLNAYAWAYADGWARKLFLDGEFLDETVLCDDYIAYIVQEGTKRQAFLSFMNLGEAPVDLDPGYAYKICREWERKGYDATIMYNYVSVIYKEDNSSRLSIECFEEGGTNFWAPVEVGNEYIFVGVSDPFWWLAEALFYSAVTSNKRSIYECLFEEEVVLVRADMGRHGRYENAETIISGIDNIKRYFESKPTLTPTYVKQHNSPAYDFYLMDEQTRYILAVGSKNQISKIIEEKMKDIDRMLAVPSHQLYQPYPMPSAVGVRPLDIAATHAYGIRITYSDGCEKNYYLHGFDTRELPGSVVVEGYLFDRSVLHSVHLTEEGVEFSNGYHIPAHILYYRGISQLIPEKIGKTVFENDKIKIVGAYRLPLQKRRGGLWRTFAPRPDQYYGVNSALIDADGNRANDYSGSHITNEKGVQIYQTHSEVNDKIGFLRKDGSWLIPPIFDEAEEFEDDCCTLAKIGNQQYLINMSGEMIPFEYEINTKLFFEGRCAFSVKKYEGAVTYPEEHFEGLSPGMWGFIDENGKVVIEPQFVFTTGFCYEKNRAFVAKVINGATLWGIIDENGNEVVPCIYPNLATHCGNAVYFQRKRYDDYGLMDFDGNVIMEPRYRYIFEYDGKHDLVAAAYDWHERGVAKVSDGQVIIPFEYEESVGFYDTHIECESFQGVDYFDYTGKPMPPDFDGHCWERNGNYAMRKDNKCGLMDANGNVIVPFIFDKADHMDYYLCGYLITGTKGRRGISKLDGSVLLPQKYMDISMRGRFIIASYGIESRHTERQELYLTDGTSIFDDLFRGVYIRGDVLRRETPWGEEIYQIKYKQ